MRLVSLFAFFFIFASCGAAEKRADVQSAPSAVPSPFTPSMATRLTLSGENQMGHFSSDGTKVVFQSRNRPAHKSSQIYIYNFAANKEKRITFNDGDDSSPSFDASGKYIIYTSTTDEIKEHPEAASSIETIERDPTVITDSKAKFEEVYISEADGSHIRRLTNSVGFDGQASAPSTGTRFVFVSEKNGPFELYAMDTRGRGKTRILTSQDTLAHPSLSPNGKLVVYESRTEKDGPVQIRVSDLWGKNNKTITTKESVNRDPSWTPDGKRLVFSSNRDKSNVFLIYSVGANGECLKLLSHVPELKSKTDLWADLYPSVSPDGRKLLYTSNAGGVYQLYIKDFIEPADCLTDKP